MTFWFDRDDLLAALSKRVKGFHAGYRQNVALLGPEAVGKTTLLKRLLQQESTGSPSLIAFYVEVRDGESFAEWASRFVETLLYEAQEVTRNIPETAACAKRLLLALAQEERDDELYEILWDLPQRLTQETGVPCLLLLDEFHRLGRFSVKGPFQKLGRAIMVQSATMYMLASSQPSVARKILREGLNLLFGQFETVEVGPLDPAASLRAIQSVWSEDRGDPFLAYLLVELAQGYPAYLDPLVHGLVNRPDQERALLDLLEELLLEPNGILRQRFEGRLRLIPIHRSRRTCIQVLAAAADGFHRVEQIGEALDRSPSQILRALHLLEQVGLVAKQGVFYRIPDRLFQLWMLTAYPILQGVALTDPTHIRVRFRDAAWSWVLKVREAIHLPLEDQVKELVCQWGGELVEIEGRRILLPKSGRVELLPVVAGRTLLVAHPAGESGKSWLLIPWAGSLEEAQARQIIQEISALPLKNYRKVLLGAHPVEINARLVLQEARVRLWDLRVLNNLLDLYGLTRIPLPAGLQAPLAPTIQILSEQLPLLTSTKIERAK